MDTAMFLGGRTLPKYLKYTRVPIENSYTNETLDGTLFTDYLNRRYKHIIEYDLLTSTEYETIQDLWEEQFDNNLYHMFQFDAKDVYSAVKLSINDQNIIHGAQYYEGVVIELDEQGAIS